MSPTISQSTQSLGSDSARLKLAVLIVNFNGWPDVIRLVSSLAQAPEVAAGDCEIIVIDNASDGPIPPEFNATRPGVRLILRSENGGFAAGINTGLAQTDSPWLLLLNPDVVAEPAVIGRVIDRLRHHKARRDGTPGIIGFALRNPDGTRQHSVGAEPGLLRSVCEAFIPRSRRKYQAGWRTKAGPVPWVTGACAAVDAQMLRKLGGMDEDFFLYYEEVALCRSTRRLGCGVEFDSSVEVVHLRPLQNRRVSLGLRVITRHSKLLFFRKHLPSWQFEVMCRVVAVEAAVRGAWSRLTRRESESRAWRAIGKVVRAMHEGAQIRGREILPYAAVDDPPRAGVISPEFHRADSSQARMGRLRSTHFAAATPAIPASPAAQGTVHSP